MRKEIPISEIKEYVGKSVVILDDEGAEKEIEIIEVSGWVRGHSKKTKSLVGISPSAIKKIYIETE